MFLYLLYIIDFCHTVMPCGAPEWASGPDGRCLFCMLVFVFLFALRVLLCKTQHLTCYKFAVFVMFEELAFRTFELLKHTLFKLWNFKVSCRLLFLCNYDISRTWNIITLNFCFRNDKRLQLWSYCILKVCHSEIIKFQSLEIYSCWYFELCMFHLFIISQSIKYGIL